VATGTNTLATGNVTDRVLQTPGGVTTASGEAAFAAEGTGPGATATAHSGVNVTGADLVVETTVNQHGGTSTDATAESVTTFRAIDIPGFTPPGGPVIVDHVVNSSSTPAGGSGLPSGNVVHTTLTAEAAGVDPQVTALSQTLAVGGHLSAVSAWALVAA
jgi:hypothetical protein